MEANTPRRKKEKIKYKTSKRSFGGKRRGKRKCEGKRSRKTKSRRTLKTGLLT
jgi:hypothetical protein